MITIIFGMTGTGKSTKIRELIKTINKPIYIIDSLGEYQGDIVFDELSKLLISTIERPELHSEGRKIVCRFIARYEIDYLCAYLFEIGDACLVIDEVDMFTNANYASDELAKIIRYGRHRNLDLITASRRFADVPRLLTSQAHYAYLFHIVEPRDLKSIEERYGKEASEKVKNLSQFDYVLIDVRNNKIIERSSENG